MHTNKLILEIFIAIAGIADLCLKPYKYSVVNKSSIQKDNDSLIDDLLIILECRDLNGSRKIENDIEVEIYKSGSDINLTLSLKNNEDYILWQGEHSLWMNASTGKRIARPEDSTKYESLARRVRVLCDSYT